MTRVSRLRALGCFLLMCLVTACGSVTPESPTSPTAAPASPGQQFPSLFIGMWSGSAGATIINPISGREEGDTCPLLGGISTQSGGEFSGGFSGGGTSSASERRCLFNNRFTGVMTPDGTVTSLRFDPPFSLGGCTIVEGTDVYTGRVSSDGTSLRVSASGRWTCIREFTIPAAGSVEGPTTATISISKR